MNLFALAIFSGSALLLAGCAPQATSTAPPPAQTQVSAPPASAAYAIPDTEVVDIHSTRLDRDYQLFVALPESYATQPQRRYPVVFVTDANYAFPLVRAISRRVGDHGKGLEEFILVGLSYAKGHAGLQSPPRLHAHDQRAARCGPGGVRTTGAARGCRSLSPPHPG